MYTHVNPNMVLVSTTTVYINFVVFWFTSVTPKVVWGSITHPSINIVSRYEILFRWTPFMGTLPFDLLIKMLLLLICWTLRSPLDCSPLKPTQKPGPVRLLILITLDIYIFLKKKWYCVRVGGMRKDRKTLLTLTISASVIFLSKPRSIIRSSSV